MTLLSADPEFFDVNGVRLAVWERPGSDPPVFFAHATGFHAHCWNQVVQRIPERRCIAVDLRGHGLSSKPHPPYEWHTFGYDVAALARVLRLRGATAVGHSMGGHSVTLAAALEPDIFDRLILVDPVILQERAYSPRRRHEHFARKRKNHWSSAHEMFERFVLRPPFRDWDPDVLHDYCKFGLVRAPDHHGYVLACPPEIEGSIYEASALPDADLYDKIRAIDVPVMVVRSAKPIHSEPAIDMAASPTAPDLASHFKHGRDVLTAHSHFIPMEAPGFIAELISDFQ